jgi:hypothetical protein
MFTVNESEPLTYILGTVTMLMALLLAWRGYRHLAREDEERKKAKKRQEGPNGR